MSTPQTYVVQDDISGETYRSHQAGGARVPAATIYHVDGANLRHSGEEYPLPVKIDAPDTAGTLTTFTSTSDAQIFAANPARRGATIYNRGAGTLFIRFGGGAASAAAFNVRLLPDQYLELPFGYTGQVRGIFDSAGSANCMELT